MNHSKLNPAQVDQWIEGSIVRQAWLAVAMVSDPTETLRASGLVPTSAQLWERLDALLAGDVSSVLQGVAADLRSLETVLGFVAVAELDASRDVSKLALGGQMQRSVGQIARALEITHGR